MFIVTIDQTYATISSSFVFRILDTAANTSRIIDKAVEMSKRVVYFVHYHHDSNYATIIPSNCAVRILDTAANTSRIIDTAVVSTKRVADV